MNLLEQLQRMRRALGEHESLWVELHGARLKIAHPDSGRGLELCWDDSDEVLIVFLADLGVEVEDA